MSSCQLHQVWLMPYWWSLFVLMRTDNEEIKQTPVFRQMPSAHAHLQASSSQGGGGVTHKRSDGEIWPGIPTGMPNHEMLRNETFGGVNCDCGRRCRRLVSGLTWCEQSGRHSDIRTCPSSKLASHTLINIDGIQYINICYISVNIKQLCDKHMTL